MSTLTEITNLKLRLRTLPDELNVARDAVSQLAAKIKDQKTVLGEQESEIGALKRAEILAAPGKKPAETAITHAVKGAVDKDAYVQRLRTELREIELRKDGAELQVKHLTDRFTGLQIYADLTAAEVRLLTSGLGA